MVHIYCAYISDPLNVYVNSLVSALTILLDIALYKIIKNNNYYYYIIMKHFTERNNSDSFDDAYNYY